MADSDLPNADKKKHKKIGLAVLQEFGYKHYFIILEEFYSLWEYVSSGLKVVSNLSRTNHVIN